MRLSIIIIEYHCMDQVDECLESISRYLGDVSHECLIISNSMYSTEELNQFSEQLKTAKIIDSGGNLGYAGGVNKGIKHAHGEYIYVLNPDCLLTDANVVQIMQAMDQEADWAIAGPKVIDQDGNVQPSCRAFPRPWTFLLVRSALSKLPGASRERRRYLMEDFDRQSIREVDWVSGGATLVKASSLEKIGGMDERYFLYMEDVDWCHNCWDSGHKVKYAPLSTVIHAGQHQSISGSLISKLMSKHVRMHITSLIKYFLKHKFR